MPNPIASNIINDGISILLDKVLKTRLQRRAKSIIISSVQFLLLALAILLIANDLEYEKKLYQIIVYALIGASMFYVFVIMVFLFFHAKALPMNLKTTMDVEVAYSRTNMIPLLDSIFEIHFPLRFRGNKWYFPYIIWGFSAGLVAGTVVVFLLIRDEISASTTSLMISAALILYQITGDFAEYWVHSRNQAYGKTSSSDQEV
jgi:hypothetical protein